MLANDGTSGFAPGAVFRAAAVDLGGSSGRVISGVSADGRVRLDGVHRFENRPFADERGLRWDVQRLFRDAVAGLELARRGGVLASIGVDSWSGDYGLLGPESAGRRLRPAHLVDAPFHQRDPRTNRVIATAHERLGDGSIFESGGTAEMPFLPLFQLLADLDDGRLDAARRLLLIPDLISAWLGGAEVAEATNASTTGLLAPDRADWDLERIRTLELPERLFAEVVPPGTVTGAAAGFAWADAAERPIAITTVASHDTASAVVAVPAGTPNFAYVSCGTWVLTGVEIDRIVTSEAARDAGFTNELGIDGTNRFLHISPGFWILNECVREWRAATDGATIELAALLDAAAREPRPDRVIDTSDPDLMRAGGMLERIARCIARVGAPVPTSFAATVRLIVESLAAGAAERIAEAVELSRARVDVVHVVGGGAQSALLCQALAERTGLPVIAGPVEATAYGNLLVQARAHGAVEGGLSELRDIVRASVGLERYEPGRRS